MSRMHFCEILDNWEMLKALTLEAGEEPDYDVMKARLKARWEASYRPEPIVEPVQVDEIYVPETVDLAEIPF